MTVSRSVALSCSDNLCYVCVSGNYLFIEFIEFIVYIQGYQHDHKRYHMIELSSDDSCNNKANDKSLSLQIKRKKKKKKAGLVATLTS